MLVKTLTYYLQYTHTGISNRCVHHSIGTDNGEAICMNELKISDVVKMTVVYK